MSVKESRAYRNELSTPDGKDLTHVVQDPFDIAW